MDEDIKIVENFIQYNKFYKEENGKLTITIDLDAKTTLDKATENLLSRFKTAERMNDVLVEQLGKNYTNCKFCKNFVGNSYMFACKEYSNKNQCIKEWARKKVEENV